MIFFYKLTTLRGPDFSRGELNEPLSNLTDRGEALTGLQKQRGEILDILFQLNCISLSLQYSARFTGTSNVFDVKEVSI